MFTLANTFSLKSQPLEVKENLDDILMKAFGLS